MKVDEKGKEVAAVTKVVMTLGIEKTAKMVVDKPFLFLLCNKKQMNKCIFIAKIEKYNMQLNKKYTLLYILLFNRTEKTTNM